MEDFKALGSAAVLVLEGFFDMNKQSVLTFLGLSDLEGENLSDDTNRVPIKSVFELLKKQTEKEKEDDQNLLANKLRAVIGYAIHSAEHMFEMGQTIKPGDVDSNLSELIMEIFETGEEKKQGEVACFVVHLCQTRDYIWSSLIDKIDQDNQFELDGLNQSLINILMSFTENEITEGSSGKVELGEEQKKEI